MAESNQPAGVAFDRVVRPFAWVDPLYLRMRQTGGVMTVTDFPGEIRTEPLYTQAALDAAVAAERERWTLHAYAKLGAERDSMSAADVEAVQQFLGPLGA